MEVEEEQKPVEEAPRRPRREMTGVRIAREITERCETCGGKGWLGEAQHHPACDGSCTECPVDGREQCHVCGSTASAVLAVVQPLLDQKAREIERWKERTWGNLRALDETTAERDALREKVAVARADTLREVAAECSLDHEARGYVVVQMDTETWATLTAALASPTPGSAEPAAPDREALARVLYRSETQRSGEWPEADRARAWPHFLADADAVLAALATAAAGATSTPGTPRTTCGTSPTPGSAEPTDEADEAWATRPGCPVTFCPNVWPCPEHVGEVAAPAAPEGEPEDEPDDWACQQVGYHLRTGRHVKGECRGEQEDEQRPLPLHRTEAGYPRCATCDGGGCLDCTDPA